jgi:hypothetical protein
VRDRQGPAPPGRVAPPQGGAEVLQRPAPPGRVAPPQGGAEVLQGPAPPGRVAPPQGGAEVHRWWWGVRRRLGLPVHDPRPRDGGARDRAPALLPDHRARDPHPDRQWLHDRDREARPARGRLRSELAGGGAGGGSPSVRRRRLTQRASAGTTTTSPPSRAAPSSRTTPTSRRPPPAVAVARAPRARASRSAPPSCSCAAAGAQRASSRPMVRPGRDPRDELYAPTLFPLVPGSRRSGTISAYYGQQL